MFFDWIMDNPMYIVISLVSAILVVLTIRLALLEDLDSSDDEDGGITDSVPDVDLPLPSGVVSPVDEQEVVE